MKSWHLILCKRDPLTLIFKRTKQVAVPHYHHFIEENSAWHLSFNVKRNNHYEDAIITVPLFHRKTISCIK